MEWSVVLPRFARALRSGAYLALCSTKTAPNPWDDALILTIQQYSTNRDYQPYNLVEELEKRGLFETVGEQEIAPQPFSQPLHSYIEALHSMNGFSRQRMLPESADAFDSEVAALVTPYCVGGEVKLQVGANLTWGLPLASHA